MKTVFIPELTTATIKLQDSRYVIFNPKGIRADSKHTEREAIKTAKRLFPDSKIVVDS